MTKHHLTIGIAALFCYAAVPSQAQNHAPESKDFVAGPAPAPEDAWKFSVTPYVWVPAIDIDVFVPTVTINGRTFGGELSLDNSWTDTLGNSGKVLEISGDGRFEFSKGHWGGFIDGYYMYSRVEENDGNNRFILRDQVEVARAGNLTNHFKTGQVNFGPRYLFTPLPLGAAANGSNVVFELYGGGRVNWYNENVEGDVTLTLDNGEGEVTQDFSFDRSASRAYAEPMLGLKSTWTLGRDFIFMVRGDVGGFGIVASNNWDTDLEAGLGWQFHHNMFLDLAYRARGQWQDAGSRGNVSLSGWFHGPELGVTFAF